MFTASLASHRPASIAAFALQLPEDLTALSDEELSNLLEQGTQEFDGLLDDAGDAPSAEQLSEMEGLRDQIVAVRNERDRPADRIEHLADPRQQFSSGSADPGT